MKYCLAIDVAERKSLYYLVSDCGEIVLNPTEYEHKVSKFQFIKGMLDRLECDDVHIIMESTSIYHLPVERFFKENSGYNVIILNPIISKENKRTLRKTKTDKEDCFNLASIFFKQTYNLQTNHDDIYKELQTLSRQLNHLREGQNRTKNRFKQLLELTCPEYLSIFKGSAIYSETSLHFIKNYPHCDMVKNKRIDALAYCLSSVHQRHPNYYRKKAERIKEGVQDCYPAVTADSETTHCLVAIIKQIIVQDIEINSIKEKLITLAKTTELYQLYISIYGIGEITTALLIAELKDIRRFSNVKKLNASCGLDPTIIQSGKSINFHGPISKRGNRLSRKTLFYAVMSIMGSARKGQPNHPILLYYEKKRNEGKHHYACVIACTTKLLRILFALAKQNKTYEPIIL